MVSDSIIIVGAGFGGLATAFELARRKEKLGGREIFLIDRNPHHLYTPLLYEIATGYDSREIGKDADRSFENTLAAGAAFSFREGIGARLKTAGIHFLNEEVMTLDAPRHTITLSDGRTLAWSNLVLALGGETDFYGITGLKEHSFQLKSLRQALAIRRRLHELLRRKQKGELAHVSIVIGGAGATGVEFAGELVRFFEHAIAHNELRPSDLTITVVEASRRVLSMFDEKFSSWAQDRLERWCVKFYFDTCIQEVREGQVVLAPRPLRPGETADALVCDFRAEKQKIIPADLLVWTGGVRGNAVLDRWGFDVDAKGRVAVDTACRAKDHADIFVIGDAASLENPTTKRSVPWLAQTAIEQAGVVAAQIIGEDQQYAFPYIHTIIPVGAKYAIADVGGFKFHGFSAWLVRQLADIRYFLKIVPPLEALRLWFLGARVYMRND